MRKDMLCKTLVIGVIVLFIGVGIQPILAIKSISTLDAVKDEDVLSSIPKGRKTIYVDDDNTEGPWDGTLEHPYRYIQDGVDNAISGDTVFVYSGTYSHRYPQDRGCVDIYKKNINLIGENKYTTFIDAPNEYILIHVDAPIVTISGFTLKYSDFNAIGIEIGFNYVQEVTINDNILSGSNRKYEYAIMIWMGENKIYNNIISNSATGINMQGGDNKVYYNLIFNNSIGITIHRAGFHTEVYNNRIKNNSYGIFVSYSKSQNIHNNMISGNDYGIFIENSRSIIRGNNFIQNRIQAYFLNYFLGTLGINNWIHNYWDDWEKTDPRPIKGEWGPFISYQYDWFPASKPNPVEIPDTSFIQGCGIE